jgi:alpha-tubulin suppressor-like RCC1 family protein
MGNNEYGQLGLPNISIIQRPQLLPFSQKIAVNRLFVGPDFSYCITVSHQVYSWGLNLKGQLGLGHFENVPFPALVKNLSIENKKDKAYEKGTKSQKLKPHETILHDGELIIDISCGALHTIALSNKSRVYSCGFGENFSLGHNSNKTLNYFKEISFFHQLSSSSSHKIEKICSGTSHSGALVAGKVYIWGTFAHSKYCLNKIPNALHLNQPIVDFVLGDLLTVILTKSGEVFTLGENTDGQLGIKEVNNYNIVKVEIPCKIEYICCGLNHVVAINNTDGTKTIFIKIFFLKMNFIE